MPKEEGTFCIIGKSDTNVEEEKEYFQRPSIGAINVDIETNSQLFSDADKKSPHSHFLSPIT
jgi:hypothetical protein